ncbi:GNAT family N-acetyltransferase [Paracoccus benzoatiresistens]|uniref:GNAT family protein n=1 Tax=Paracoccus benzoatiresistens TaxID=2997341 RepID=A0ABT4J323_9RHOB|nr:GNAT family protein [Paracoccus sp. EF6]MCZ0961519.1 GNAT family protein [Paracoccus sp. EF6]
MTTASPIGTDAPLSDFVPPPSPAAQPIRSDILQPVSADRHAADLFDTQAGHDGLWTWLPYGPFQSRSEHHAWVAQAEASSDPVFLAILDPQTRQAAGHASFLRIDTANGVIEIGHIMLTPSLQRSRTASAALMAMISWAFEHGYRRVEWKCNALNGPSRRAALRLGFTYEGTFRNHMIVKGQNRDTAWFSIIDNDWRALAPAYAAWLDDANFDAGGRQRSSLSDLTCKALPGRGGG